MRKLFVLRGLPGCGKSTFITDNQLEPYTLSPDTFRLQSSGVILNLEGRLAIDQKASAKAWDNIREHMEARMQAGDTLVIDATHTIDKYFADYQKLCYKYRYEQICIDFSDVPLQTCKDRNRGRVDYKQVPDIALDRLDQQLKQSLRLPKYVRVIKPEDFTQDIATLVTDLSSYSTIHTFGDIQGCSTPLIEYFEKYPYSNLDYYIFAGDLLDRGKQNGEVMAYILDNLADKPNVAFVEGNHDLYIWEWVNGREVNKKEFDGRTKPQLEAANLDKGAIRRLCLKMVPYFIYDYKDTRVLVTHGGLSAIPDNMELFSARQCIGGVGGYDETKVADDAFEKHYTSTDLGSEEVATLAGQKPCDEHVRPRDHLATNRLTGNKMVDSNIGLTTYSIHGHRNPHDLPTQVNSRCFNLEGKVEFGGELRVIQHASKFEVVEIKNGNGLKSFPENASQIHSMRKNSFIHESMLPGSISSFNFTTKAFFDKHWTDQTTTARGFFVNTLSNEIVARSYNKFFNVGERRDTELAALKDKLVFPIKAWVKENGYLGIVGFDSTSGDLVIASKSTTEGDFAGWFRQLFMKKYTNILSPLKGTLERENATLVFEVILPSQDPHIIPYAVENLVLLEAISREKDFRTLPAVAESMIEDYGMQYKKLGYTFETFEQFEAFALSTQSMDFKHEGQYLEGFVIEDMAGYHVKLKTAYYAFWKQMRTQLDNFKSGKTPKVPEHSPDPLLAEKVITTFTPTSTLFSLQTLFEK
jgi:predicted kinase